MAKRPQKRKADEADTLAEESSAKSRRGISEQRREEQSSEASELLPLTQLSQVAGADEADDEAANVVSETHGGERQPESVSERMLYGVLETKIVGVRYYRGFANVGEHVILKREPENQYDKNAIRVTNVMGDQIGHIGRHVAARLAPYMDSGDLQVEGILTGQIGTFDCPVALPLYGTANVDDREGLKQRMQADRLPLKEFQEAKRAETQRRKEAEAAAKAAAKQARALALGKAATSWQSNENAMFANLSSPTGLAGDLNPSKSFSVKARQGLAWLIDRESPAFPPPGSDGVVQLWKRSGKQYNNIATNFTTPNEPPLASGGILADDMGLGKTIQIISLILANSAPRTSASSKSTLIIAPVGVMSNWRNQIHDHTRAESTPRVLIYHGTAKKEVKDLTEYDVVITSYGALVQEYNPEAKSPLKGIFSVHWRRIVLDEGHQIRNPQSKGSLAACSLRADSRWTLTGTPIINTLRDLYSQVRFLKLTGGLEEEPMFNTILIRPLTCGSPDARLLLEALMGTICLRRRKDMNFINLRLPPMTSRILRVKFNDYERERYSAFQSEAKGALLNLKDKQGQSSYSHLLEVLLRLRQVCNHWALCKRRVEGLMELLEKHKVVPLTPENMKALQEMLQLQIESQEMCAVCLDNLDQPVITACAHTFCRACIEQVISRQHKCPLCRADIKDNSTLVAPATNLGEDADTATADPQSPSSKIEALMKVLTAQGQAPDTKTVVFSQWTSFLDLVEPHLEARGINYVRIDGKMNSIQRDNSLTVFTKDPSCTVLLASLSVCSVGLNLVAANQAILADSWWAPAIEDQAVDRVYRLGQKRETTVWRLVVEDSIEERVLDIQKRKRDLMNAAFRETGKKKAEDRATRIADLESLLA
ncbi:hypothetical protein N7468_008123 [Penicillium chermesinum]|uniref:SNF2 family helicase n=1 Tax=Penicillium chermesinum TaxID=63820 RepID=A0A9W9TI29_9EURO|nr:uncharacterized protein N7468_008123 [Penicillium chermesinum]KAJ5223581.1 hypothetical protein N7468_008123 [Penicillium chermesinum]